MFFPIAYQLTHGFVDFQIFGCSQTVGKEFAIQVIQFMLDAAAEQTAALAERASIKYKQVEFMKDRLGETFEGTISGVTEFGLFVEVNENKCEGFVPLRDLDDDYYEFDEKNFCLRGRRRNRSYNLGDQVHIQVARADLYRKQLDYKLVRPEKK